MILGSAWVNTGTNPGISFSHNFQSTLEPVLYSPEMLRRHHRKLVNRFEKDPTNTRLLLQIVQTMELNVNVILIDRRSCNRLDICRDIIRLEPDWGRGYLALAAYMSEEIIMLSNGDMVDKKWLKKEALRLSPMDPRIMYDIIDETENSTIKENYMKECFDSSGGYSALHPFYSTTRELPLCYSGYVTDDDKIRQLTSTITYLLKHAPLNNVSPDSCIYFPKILSIYRGNYGLRFQKDLINAYYELAAIIKLSTVYHHATINNIRFDFLGLMKEAKSFGDRAHGDRVFLLKGNDNSRPAWYYILVTGSLSLFLEVLTGGGNDAMHLVDYGEIVESGYGSEPPECVSKYINNRFGGAEDTEHYYKNNLNGLNSEVTAALVC